LKITNRLTKNNRKDVGVVCGGGGKEAKRNGGEAIR
jgi:hypothetical protein